ncbi:hypothetical protein [Methylobacterium haplocladii]|uniref:Uncharacterized protein n=1 Tax=Methylobacterium haplocladii TaxID=1176176 RepID=A0A512IQT0_9HYPH|nr:hypothetical protein [Methylobacterium haplocladii]GEP00075.1 hypothetical protein MHA02_24620 [Methylobacterium haplocladii]
MIASTALELLLLGLAVWQLIVVRRSIKADREKGERGPPERSQSDMAP